MRSKKFIHRALVCPAKGKKCNKLGVLSHCGRVCRKPQEQRLSQKHPPRRMHWVDEESDNNDEQGNEEQYVPGNAGCGSPPIMMKG